MPPSDPWQPERYHRFRAERSRPFHDLLEMLADLGPVQRPRIVDLGCGSGELTRVLHERFPGARTTGIDASPAMLERSAAHAGPDLDFRTGDLRDWVAETDAEPVDDPVSWEPEYVRVAGAERLWRG